MVNPIEFIKYECSNCGIAYPNRRDALMCKELKSCRQKYHGARKEKWFRCGKCNHEYYRKESVENCCSEISAEEIYNISYS